MEIPLRHTCADLPVVILIRGQIILPGRIMKYNVYHVTLQISKLGNHELLFYFIQCHLSWLRNMKLTVKNRHIQRVNEVKSVFAGMQQEFYMR